MTKRLVLVLMALTALALSQRAHGGPPAVPRREVTARGDSTAQDGDSTGQCIRRRVTETRAFLFLSGGRVVKGTLQSAGKDAIGVVNEGRIQTAPLSDVRRAIIESNRNYGRGVPFGFLLGLMIGGGALVTPDGQPGGFLKGEIKVGDFFGLLGLSVAGMAVGEVMNTAATKSFDERVFDLDASDELRGEFSKYLRSTLAPRKLHLTLSGGSVFTNFSSRYNTLLGGKSELRSFETVTADINCFRRIQVVYSLSEQVDAGAALIRLSEPMVVDYTGSPTPYGTANTGAQFIGTGYYLVGLYHPLVRTLPYWADWKLGGGIGKADIDLSIGAKYVATGPFSSPIDYAHTASRFSSLFVTDITFFLTDELSAGIGADYVWLPREHIPELPRVQVPAQELNPGNASIEITLGLHCF